MSKQKLIKYPYMPNNEVIKYVSKLNIYLTEAKEFAKEFSLDQAMPTGSIIVLNEKVIGRGANGSRFHQDFGCERVRRQIPTGQGYELCEGCNPSNHSEVQAIKNAIQKTEIKVLRNAELYLWGHWWICKDCWMHIQSVGIKSIYLEENSEILYNKVNPNNIIGMQFE
jgi:deoxycytidylate deaminase